MDDKINTDNGLIVGIDITGEHVQVSCLPFGSEKAETISTRMGMEQYEIPLCLFRHTESEKWYYGEQAQQRRYSKEGIYIEDLWEGMQKNREISLEEEVVTCEELLAIYFGKILLLISQNGYTQPLEALVFTARHMEAGTIRALQNMVRKLLGAGSRTKVFFPDYRECFSAYATGVSKDLWNHDVFLFLYQGRSLSAFQLRVYQKTLPFQIRTGEMDFGEMEYGKDELEASEEMQQDMDRRFAATVEELFARKIVSSVYLIGDGFLPGWMKESLRILCRGRRVFQGNNLFSKGACYAGNWFLNRKKPVGEYSSSQMLAAGVRIPAEAGDGAAEYLYAAKKGELWYRAGLDVECMLEPDTDGHSGEEPRRVEVEIAALSASGEACTRREVLELENYPDRPPKTSKVRVKIEFSDAETGRITVTDIGFGEFYPSSGLSWEREFSLKEAEEEKKQEESGV